MEESKFNYVTRQGIENNIKEAYIAGDMNLADAQLDLWPTGRKRAEISLERATELSKRAGIIASQDTIEFPALNA